MQSSIRERRCFKGHGRTRRATSACFKKIITSFFIISFVLSCAHKERKNNSKDQFAKLCLSGEGKGRIEHLGGRYVFSYESLFDMAKEEWTLALSLPLHGEEVLRLGYGEAFKSKVKLRGKFFKRMTYLARKERDKKKMQQIKKILLKIAIFLKTVDEVRAGDFSCNDGFCGIAEVRKFSYFEDAKGLKVAFGFDENHKLLISGSSNSPYYRKLSFVLSDKRRHVDATQPFGLTLIHRECIRPPL